MNLMTLAERLRGAADEIRSSGERDTFKIASDLLGQISSRVINTGIGADGAAFTGYSDNPLPTFFFDDPRKSTRGNVSESVKAFRNKYKGETSYKNWRDFHGLQTSHKDFAFTNQMWKNMIVKAMGDQTFTFGSKDPEDEKIMGYHQAKYSFLVPNQKEIDKAEEANKERANKILQKWLNA